MIPLLTSILATLFLPTGCSMPGWSFCVRMPADARMEVAQDQSDPVIPESATPPADDQDVAETVEIPISPTETII